MVTETDPGAHLKRWRAQSGASQRQLADLLGISHTSVRRIEAGEVQPNSDVLARFAEVTGEGSADSVAAPDSETIAEEAADTEPDPADQKPTDLTGHAALLAALAEIQATLDADRALLRRYMAIHPVRRVICTTSLAVSLMSGLFVLGVWLAYGSDQFVKIGQVALTRLADVFWRF